MMHILLRLIRIYTPFICVLTSLIYGVMYLKGVTFENFDYIMSTMTGNSILMVLFMFSCSKTMCIWYKLNLISLLLIHVTSLLYFYTELPFTLYCYFVILLAAFGLISFIIYRVTVGITKILC